MTRGYCVAIWVGVYMGQYANKLYIFGYLRRPGGGGGIQLSDWAYLALQLSSHPYLCTNSNSNNFIDPWNCITLDFCQ